MKYLLLLLIPTTFAAKTYILPKYLKKCDYSKSEDSLNECLRDSMEDALVKLKNGEPALGIQPLDPLFVTSLDILQGDGPVSLNIHHKNLKLYGASKCKVAKNTFDKRDGTMEGIIKCQKITIDGDYQLDGRVLLLPVTGKGRSVIELENNTCTYKAHGQHTFKNGVLYEKYNKIDFEINPSRLKLNFANLFGDENLSKNMNRFINENWRDILKELKPSYEAVMQQVFNTTVNQVFSKIPVTGIINNYKTLKH